MLRGLLAGLVGIIHQSDQRTHGILAPLNALPLKFIIPEGGGFFIQGQAGCIFLVVHPQHFDVSIVHVGGIEGSLQAEHVGAGLHREELRPRPPLRT